MTTYKKWTLYTLSAAAFILIIIAVANYVIDPYGFYHYAGKSYNYQKSTERDPYQFKTYQGKRYQPETLVMGTSRAMRLDPPFIESLTGESTYNLGLPAATSYINFKYLEYMLKVDKSLKTVFLGLDFEIFNEQYVNQANFDEKRLKSIFYLQDYFATLLSEKTMKDSRKVLLENLNKTTVFTESRYLGDGSFDETLVYPPDINQNTLHAIPTDFQLTQDSMLYIEKIKELCEQNGIQLHLYISPVHAILLETFWQNSMWADFEDWKRQLVAIAPLWDFSGYHEISTSSLRQSENYNDLSHFSKKIGRLMLYRMLNKETDKVPPYFGVYLTPENIDEHLNRLRLNREQWGGKGKNMFDILGSY
ncbi:hypothetical protein [Candidatus Pristimantibacillus sp. PTI5]|uniref:hypothetical protein n=1 Tax=Candidatus Pristimantibacillus sp. PTI5 TaxID=3400422 RepID=UPI003B02C4BC